MAVYAKTRLANKYIKTTLLYMKQFVDIAAIQMEIRPLDINGNLKTAERLLLEALDAHTLDLVVFPEDFITGPIPYHLEYALDIDSDPIMFMRELARKYTLFIACGSFIRKKGGKLYNTAVLIDTKGTIILEYDKNHLWHPEKRYLTAGKSLPVVKTSIGTIGLTICWDLAFPQVFQELARQGVEIICCPSYWTQEDGAPVTQRLPGVPTEITMVDALCPARAIENEVLMVYANGAGKGRLYIKDRLLSLNQIGHSQICAPLYGTVAKIESNREGFIHYRYDRKLGKYAESAYRLRQDLV